MANRLLTIVFALSIGTVDAFGQENKVTDVVLKAYNDDFDPILQWFEEATSNSNCVKELELTPKQFEELQTKLQERLKTLHAAQPRDVDEMNALNDKLVIRLREDAREVLLPHQLDKLEQLAFNDARKQIGTAGLLTMKWFRERFEISDEQVERILERAEKEKAKLEETIAKARKEAEENILDELTPDQKKKIKVLLGEEK